MQQIFLQDHDDVGETFAWAKQILGSKTVGQQRISKYCYMGRAVLGDEGRIMCNAGFLALLSPAKNRVSIRFGRVGSG